MGGNTTIALARDAGLVDALTLHLTPVMLGARTPLFTGAAPRTLVHQSVTSTSTATPPDPTTSSDDDGLRNFNRTADGAPLGRRPSRSLRYGTRGHPGTGRGPAGTWMF